MPLPRCAAQQPGETFLALAQHRVSLAACPRGSARGTPPWPRGARPPKSPASQQPGPAPGWAPRAPACLPSVEGDAAAELSSRSSSPGRRRMQVGPCLHVHARLSCFAAPAPADPARSHPCSTSAGRRAPARSYAATGSMERFATSATKSRSWFSSYRCYTREE